MRERNAGQIKCGHCGWWTPVYDGAIARMLLQKWQEFLEHECDR